MGLGKAIKKKAKDFRQWLKKPGLASKAANTKMGKLVGKGAKAVGDVAGLAAKQPFFWSGANIAGDKAVEELMDDENMFKDYLQTALRVGALHQAVKGGYKRHASKKVPTASDAKKEKAASQAAWDMMLGKYLGAAVLGIPVKAALNGDLNRETEEYLIDSPETVALEKAMHRTPVDREQNMQERIRRMAEKGQKLYSSIGARRGKQAISQYAGNVLPMYKERNSKGKVITDDTDEMKFAQQVYGLVGDPTKPRMFKDIDFDYDNLTPAQKEMTNAILSKMDDKQLDTLGTNLKETNHKFYQRLKEKGWLGENI